MIAIPCSERDANESITSSEVNVDDDAPGAAATRPPHEDLRARHGPFDAEGRTGAAAEGISVITWRVRIPQSEVLVEAEFDSARALGKSLFRCPASALPFSYTTLLS